MKPWSNAWPNAAPPPSSARFQLAQSETALRRQTNILQSILNSMGDGVIVADASGKILLFNPAAERLIRAGLGTVAPGDSFEQFQTYLSDTLTAYPTNEHPLLRAMRGEIIDGAEIFLRKSDASDGLWLTATGRPLIDEHGRIQGGVVVYTDLSARKLMERQVAEISDREQRRIGQDLHDTLCQQLVSISFATELLREKLERYKLPEAAQAGHIAEMVNDGISQARHLARGFYPVRLEVEGLASALEELAETTQARDSVSCQFSCEEQILIHDTVAGNNLYRIAQEAINNALKHGHCKNISIGLGAVDEEVILTVKDDGVGFPDGREYSSGMGLHIMNYRAKMIGASLDIRRGAGGGTIVICSFHNEHFAAQEAELAPKKGIESRAPPASQALNELMSSANTPWPLQPPRSRARRRGSRNCAGWITRSSNSACTAASACPPAPLTTPPSSNATARADASPSCAPSPTDSSKPPAPSPTKCISVSAAWPA
jgi:signal transduction histidine kinase